MAYKRVNWKDHVTTKQNTYRETQNGDGSITHTPDYGEVIQEGTPQSATHFNNSDEFLQHLSIAFDMLCTISYAEHRRLDTLEKKVAELATE